MANFVQNNSSPFAKINLYQPDWSFLTTVMGTRQAEYDRGFEAVQNYNKTILDSPLTNGENIEFRQNGFKKLEQSLRSVANLDLSDPQNISRATGLLDPLAKDADLAYDRYWTSLQNEEKSKMEYYKNSTDPEVRKQYNQYAELRLNYAEEDLRKAHRGDGSIRQVQPKEFVPFDDVIDFLNTAAEKQKVGVKFSYSQNGYIITQTNGPDIIGEDGKPIYQPSTALTNWAYAQMGDRFDRQFQVIGEVQGETLIRNTMEQQGVSRQDAIGIVSQQLAPQLQNSQAQTYQQSSSQSASIDLEIAKYKEKYIRDGQFETVEIAKGYADLLDTKDALEKQKSNSENEIIKLQDTNYVASNLYSLLSSSAKEQSALSWGESLSQATSQHEIKADEVVLTQWRISAENWRFQQRLKYDYETLEQRKAEHAMNVQIAQNEGKLPSSTAIGYVSPTKEISGVDVALQHGTRVRNQMFHSIFNPINDDTPGLVNLVLDSEGFAKYMPSINALEQSISSQSLRLNSNDKKLLSEYALAVGYGGSLTINSLSDAQALLEDLCVATYIKASQMIDKNPKQVINGVTPSFNAALGSFNAAINDRETYFNSMDQAAKYIENNREQFKDIPIIGKTKNGNNIYDYSKLTLEQQQLLNPIMDPVYMAQINPVGQMYYNSGQSASLFAALLINAKQLSSTGTVEGDEEILAMNIEDVKKQAGASLVTAFNASTEEVNIKIVIPAKNNDEEPREVSFNVPYSTLAATPGLESLAMQAKQNSSVPSSGGMFKSFQVNPYSSITAPDYHRNMGFNWTGVGINGSNGYQINITGTAGNQPFTQGFNIDPNQVSSWEYIDNIMQDVFYNYLNQNYAEY